MNDVMYSSLSRMSSGKGSTEDNAFSVYDLKQIYLQWAKEIP